MLVLCNGMPRSASTWSFNVAMGLLRHVSSGRQVYGGYHENVAQFLKSVPPAASHVVLKCHSLDAVGRTLARTGEAKVIYTWRDVADAVVSSLGMFGGDFEDALASIDSSLELYRFHRHGGNAVIVGYEEITTAPLTAVRRVAAYLGVEEHSEIIREVAEENSFERTREKVEKVNASTNQLIRLGHAGYDPETLLHQHHIRDGRSGYGREILTVEQIARVDALMREHDLAGE
jgi:hypothetical protein